LFLHLRALYASSRENPPKITTRKAGGKGGNNVISTLIGQAACVQYDLLVACLDMDVPPDCESRRKAKREKVTCIELYPCLEGFLLDILGHPVPEDSAGCKHRLRQVDQRDPYDPGFFADNFPRNVLDTRRAAVPALDALLRVYAGE
jgi:hypothetical protein